MLMETNLISEQIQDSSEDAKTFVKPKICYCAYLLHILSEKAV
jgi:hypothetical protein